MAGTIYSDLITTNALPDAMRIIYSQELEMTARPTLIFDQPAFVEEKNEFGAQRGSQVIWTIYRQMTPSIAPLTENQDVSGGSVQDYQVSFSIAEYGDAIGTSEKLDLLSYHGPISNIVRTMLGPQMALTMDTLARNMFWNATNQTGGVTYHDYPNSKTSRAALTSSDVITAELIRQIAFNLSVRRVPLLGGQDPSYIALTHPSVIYDLRNDSNWKNAQLYAGATRIFNGEEGMMHGVRFLKSDRARLPNGGNLLVSNGQVTLSASYPAGVNSITVSDATGFAAGAEISLHNAGVSTTIAEPISGSGGPVTWYAPNGTDATQEEVIIQSISGNTITLRQKTLNPHNLGDYVTDAVDIYPITFVGGIPPLGKGVAVAPEIRVSLPTDKLRRTSYIGWYYLGGWGVIRDWTYEVLETAASVSAPMPFGV
jgi:N4-gp56 family major capsid protein